MYKMMLNMCCNPFLDYFMQYSSLARKKGKSKVLFPHVTFDVLRSVGVNLLYCSPAGMKLVQQECNWFSRDETGSAGM